MGFSEVLTLIFVLLKVFGVITWSWWLVFSPIIVVLGCYLVIWLAAILISTIAG